MIKYLQAKIGNRFTQNIPMSLKKVWRKVVWTRRLVWVHIPQDNLTSGGVKGHRSKVLDSIQTRHGTEELTTTKAPHMDCQPRKCQQNGFQSQIQPSKIYLTRTHQDLQTHNFIILSSLSNLSMEILYVSITHFKPK